MSRFSVLWKAQVCFCKPQVMSKAAIVAVWRSPYAGAKIVSMSAMNQNQRKTVQNGGAIEYLI